MKEGFYYYESSIYYGRYDETQISGRMSLSMIKPEQIQTDHPVSESDWAVHFQDNHRLLKPEYENLQTMLLKTGSFLKLNTGQQEIDFSTVETKLNVPIPVELRQVYTAIHDQPEYFTSVEHFLPLDEIYMDQEIIVFFKKKRTPIAGYDTESGCLARYYKKEWDTELGDMCCYQFCVGRILTTALQTQPLPAKVGRFNMLLKQPKVCSLKVIFFAFTFLPIQKLCIMRYFSIFHHVLVLYLTFF